MLLYNEVDCDWAREMEDSSCALVCGRCCSSSSVKHARVLWKWRSAQAGVADLSFPPCFHCTVEWDGTLGKTQDGCFALVDHCRRVFPPVRCIR